MKICGLQRREDVLAADALGVEYLGVVVTAGFGRSVTPAAATALVAGVRATPVAVMVDETPDAAAALGAGVGAGVLQLHGEESPEAVRALAAMGSWHLWKSVRAGSLDDVRRAVDRYGPWVHGILVEGRRHGVVGGGGAVLDPEAFAALRTALPSPLRFILAGGLKADTVAASVARWEPDVVDVSSGVETERGRKDHDLVRRFVHAARRTQAAAANDPSEDLGVSR